MENNNIPVWTILSLLNWAKQYFEKHNVPEPKRNAELILSFVLGFKSILNLYLDFERVLAPAELSAFKKMMLRRLNREPVQYICGETSFFGYKIELSDSVLIPRFETEFVVEKALDFIDKSHKRILDLGTGSGAIIISIAKQLGIKNEYLASDKNIDALKSAKKNTVLNELKVHIFAADLLSSLKDACIDIIISNPPYIKSADISKLSPEIKDYEPVSALDGGKDGSVFYRKIITQANRVLKGTGLLIFGISSGDAITSYSGFEKVLLANDYNAVPRVLILKKIL